jgi:hypothetical protein
MNTAPDLHDLLLPFHFPCTGEFPLVLNIVSALESFYPSRGIHHFTFAGKERMALAAEFYSHFFLGRTYGKPVAASADYFSIFVIFRMNLLFHIF